MLPQFNDNTSLLKEASIKFREAKRLEYQLFKTLSEGYVLLMKAIYPDYKSPREVRDERKPLSQIGINDERKFR